MYKHYNPNPLGHSADDCVIRAIAKILGMDWDSAYLGVVMEGYAMKNMPSINEVWGSFLRHRGFERHVIPNTCPDCYTIKDFCKDHPEGKYILCTGSHAVAVDSGDYYDNWDSGNETPIMYFVKEGAGNWQGGTQGTTTHTQGNSSK